MTDPLRESFLQDVESRTDLDGRFVDIRRVGLSGGAGAFSLVFSARDRTTAQRVAIKVCHPLVPFRDSYRSRSFEREARILWDLRGQQDIVRCVAPRSEFIMPMTMGSGATVPIPVGYYAMELGVDSVGAAIAAGGWDAERSLVAFGGMCRAVQRIHGQGIVHRDLKPENFLVMPDKTVKLSDFGTARRPDESALEPDYQIWPGDRRHTAPEMFALLHDHEPDIAFGADIFALGTILFELFAGAKLGLQIYDRSFAEDLAVHMSGLKREDRRRIYDGFVASIAAARPLPGVAEFGQPIPGAITARVDRLYQTMAAVDYRRRPRDFRHIFHEVERCLFVLRRQKAYDRLQEFRRRRRAGRLAREVAIALRRVGR